MWEIRLRELKERPKLIKSFNELLLCSIAVIAYFCESFKPSILACKAKMK